MVPFIMYSKKRNNNAEYMMSKHGGKEGCCLRSCHAEDWRSGLHSWYAIKGSGFGGNLQKVRKQSNTECKHKQIDMLAFQNN